MTRSPEGVQRAPNALGDPGPCYLLALPFSENRKPRGHKMAAPPPGFVSKFQAGKGKEAKEKSHMPVGPVPFYQEKDNFSLGCHLQVIGQNYVTSPMTA